MTRNALSAALLLLAACARSEDASLAPSDGNQAAQTVETVRPERDDEEVEIGEWRDSLQEDQRALEFGPAGAPPLFSLRCDARGGIHLQRHGQAPAGDLPVMLVSVGSETRRLAITSAGGAIPMLRAALNATDQLLTILTRATSPIAVRIGDAPPLILPPSPLIGTYIGRCASGAGGRGAEAESNSAAPANAAAPAE